MKKVWYDLCPLAIDFMIVEGPEGYKIDEIDPDQLPLGFRMISQEEFNWMHLEAGGIDA